MKFDYKKNKYKVAALAIITLVLIFNFTRNSTPQPQPPKPVSFLEKFTDPSNSISFNFNPYFKVSKGEGLPSTEWRLDSKYNGMILAKLIIPKEYMPGTNFSEAKFTVGRSADAAAIRSCTSKPSNIKEEGISRDIDGYKFTQYEMGDAGAGNFYETTSYAGIVDGDCYVLEYTIHSTNIGAYSPDQGITEFDHAKIVSEMDKVISSFDFLINSD